MAAFPAVVVLARNTVNLVLVLATGCSAQTQNTAHSSPEPTELTQFYTELIEETNNSLRTTQMSTVKHGAVVRSPSAYSRYTFREARNLTTGGAV